MRVKLIPMLLVVGLSGCAYVIPEDPNAPRHNIVEGGRHRPQLNHAVGPQSARALPQEERLASAPSPAMAGLPPVDPATQAMAAEQLQMTAAPPPVAPIPVSEPIVNPVPGEFSERRMPQENGQYQMAALGYPPINDVPPRPDIGGPNSVDTRLDATRRELEQNRSQAYDQRQALDRAAAAEPSMLSDLPNSEQVVPPADPVQVKPVLPSPDILNNEIRYAPPENGGGAALPQASSPQLAYTPAPLPPPPSLPSVAPLMAAPAITPNVVRGDFDPLAAADAKPIANGGSVMVNGRAVATPAVSYIPPSRYASRRY